MRSPQSSGCAEAVFCARRSSADALRQFSRSPQFSGCAGAVSAYIAFHAACIRLLIAINRAMQSV